MSSKILESSRTSIWVLLAIVVAFVSWVAGIATDSAVSDGCTRAEHNAAIIYLLGALLAIGAFYALQRLPFFDLTGRIHLGVLSLVPVLPVHAASHQPDCGSSGSSLRFRLKGLAEY